MLEIIKEIEPIPIFSQKIPDGIYMRDVCSLSGAVPNKYCPHIIKGYYIRDITDIELCKMHLSQDNEIRTIWPPELAAWAQIRARRNFKVSEVKILHPTEAKKFILQGERKKERILFSAEGAAKYYWYLNGKYIGSDRGEGLFADVPSGRHRISVIAGDKSDSTTFRISRTDDLRNDMSEAQDNILD
jgi:membrane carboxypeptidase/penicillin-binding protein PbpC